MENMNYEQWDSPSEMETAFNAEAVPNTEVIPDATSPPDRETIVEMEEAVNESSGQPAIPEPLPNRSLNGLSAEDELRSPQMIHLRNPTC